MSNDRTLNEIDQSGNPTGRVVQSILPPAPTCTHCGTELDFHDRVSVLCSNLQVARSEIERLKAEVSARYTVEQIDAWDEYTYDIKTEHGSRPTCFDAMYGIAAFIASQHKDKGT